MDISNQQMNIIFQIFFYAVEDLIFISLFYYLGIQSVMIVSQGLSIYFTDNGHLRTNNIRSRRYPYNRDVVAYFIDSITNEEENLPF